MNTNAKIVLTLTPTYRMHSKYKQRTVSRCTIKYKAGLIAILDTLFKSLTKKTNIVTNYKFNTVTTNSVHTNQRIQKNTDRVRSTSTASRPYTFH